MAKVIMTDLQKLSLDVYNGKVEKYSKEQGENAIRKAITEACGGDWNYYSFMDNKYKVFRIMSEVLSIATNGLTSEAFEAIVEVKDTNLGDKPEFIVEDNSLFRVSVIAAGTNDIRRQKIYNGKLPMTTFDLGVKVYEELDRFMAGRIDWTRVVNKVAESFANKIGALIYKGVMDSYDSLKSPYQVNGSFTEDKLAELVAHVEASTGQTAVIYGTKKALGKVKGADTLMSDSQKEERAALGYNKAFQGTIMVELPQAHEAGTQKFALSDDNLIVVPNGEKIVKLLFEGEAFIDDSTEGGKRNDRQIEYLFSRKVGVGVLKANIFGIYKLA